MRLSPILMSGLLLVACGRSDAIAVANGTETGTDTFADGPSGVVHCTDCPGIADMWVADAMGNRQPNGQLSKGTYQVWVKSDGTKARWGTVKLTRDDEEVQMRCVVAMRGCSRM